MPAASEQQHERLGRRVDEHPTARTRARPARARSGPCSAQPAGRLVRTRGRPSDRPPSSSATSSADAGMRARSTGRWVPWPWSPSSPASMRRARQPSGHVRPVPPVPTGRKCHNVGVTTPVRIHADREAGTLQIDWDDGHETTYDDDRAALALPVRLLPRRGRAARLARQRPDADRRADPARRRPARRQLRARAVVGRRPPHRLLHVRAAAPPLPVPRPARPPVAPSTRRQSA